jgi:hypothetical protein
MRFPFKLTYSKQELQLAKKLLKESRRRFPDDEAAAEEWFIEQLPYDREKMRCLAGKALAVACHDAVDMFPDRADKNKAMDWVMETLDWPDDDEWVQAVSKALDMTYPQQQ